MKCGIEMDKYSENGDVESFKRLFANAFDKEILFWHIIKSLKTAIRHK